MASTGVKLIGECPTLSLLPLARRSYAPTWTDPAFFFYSSSHLLLRLRRHRDEQTSPGIYHGKQCHAADIPAVLARARAAGVDRIIIRCFAAGHSPFRFLFLAYGSDLVCLISRFLGLVRRKVTGGSLKESREALEIAETDGELSCFDAACFDYVLLGAFKVFVVMCLRSCDVLVRCREAVLHGGRAPDEMRGRGGLYSIPVSLLTPEIGVCLSRLDYVNSALLNEFEESGDPEGHFQALLALAKEGIAKGKQWENVVWIMIDFTFVHRMYRKKYFKKQFELAEAVKLPMFLHMRAAGEDFCEIVSENLHRFPGGVTHSFTGTSEDRDKLLSFEKMFIERMMIETDSPYCDIKNTHAGIKLVKSVWPSKKKEKYEPDSTVKGRNEACLVRGIYHGKQCHAADIPAVLARAWASGVDRIIVTGGSLKESREALEIAETDGELSCLDAGCFDYVLLGAFKVFVVMCLRSCDVLEFEESGDPEGHFQALLALAKEGIAKGKVVAVGECGLDYDRLHFCPSDVQKKYFKKQFELAEAVKLPMFLHMRAAGEDFCEIVSENLYRFPGGVTHSFTGTAEDRDKLLSFEKMFIGINGCSLKTSENLEVLQGIPAERMMIETDSPYCDIKNTHAGIKFVKSVWPSKKKEKYEPDSTVKGRNEPCLVRQVLEVVAGCKGIADIEGLSKTLYHNTCRLFFPQDLDASADAQLESGASIQNS
uniref:TatD related DNase n=1 Tax=Oryza rufipogon TaxID=4529 RepID=A0A0E0Q481_ORYRU